MKSLFIDTSSSNVTIKIIENDNIVASFYDFIKDDISSKILPIIESLFKEVNFKINDIEKIYYTDIKDDRSINSNKYRKIVTIMQEHLDSDDTGNKRLNMPNLTFVKDGKIIANDNRTSLVSSDTTPEEYWTRENILTFKNNIIESILLLEDNKTTLSDDATKEE